MEPPCIFLDSAVHYIFTKASHFSLNWSSRVQWKSTQLIFRMVYSILSSNLNLRLPSDLFLNNITLTMVSTSVTVLSKFWKWKGFRCLILHSYQRNLREIRRDIFECLIRVIIEYYFNRMHYAFNWVFDSQVKIFTQTSRPYYLWYCLLSWPSSRFSYVQNSSPRCIILQTLRNI